MSKPLIPAQRRERIQDYLAFHRIARSIDLSKMLGASEATVRRDLEWLENEGLIHRTHGGAKLSHQLDIEAEYRQRAQLFSEEKYRIGKLAASMVENGDTVFLNSGTTTTQIIRNLENDLDATIITNNLIAALETGQTRYELILLGGSFQPKSNSVAGRFAASNLSNIYANKAFIGVDGIDLKYGCTVPSVNEAELIRLMIERTHGQIFITTDHSKWGRVSNFEVAKISQIQNLITDSGLDAESTALLQSLSIEIFLADKME